MCLGVQDKVPRARHECRVGLHVPVLKLLAFVVSAHSSLWLRKGVEHQVCVSGFRVHGLGFLWNVGLWCLFKLFRVGGLGVRDEILCGTPKQ